MASARTSAVAVILIVVVVQSSRVRRSDVNEYLLDTIEDASVAGDHFGVGADCSDEDSSESIELAYIINKREVLEDRRGRTPQTQTAAAAHAPISSRPNTRPIV